MTKPPLCKYEALDGRVCVLYKDHISEKHKENHLRSEWGDEMAFLDKMVTESLQTLEDLTWGYVRLDQYSLQQFGYEFKHLVSALKRLDVEGRYVAESQVVSQQHWYIVRKADG